MTPIEKFQSEHLNHLGQKLVADGVRGEQTRWAEAFELLHEEQKLILSEARDHLGLAEKPLGSNRHPRIDRWNKRCGAPVGSPWCASAASWCLSEVRSVRCALALGFDRWELEEVAEPAPADLFNFRTDDLGHGHCGLVAGFDFSAREILTYEGNVDSQFRCLLRSTEGLRFWRLAKQAGAGLPLVRKGVAFRRQALAGTR